MQTEAAVGASSPCFRPEIEERVVSQKYPFHLQSDARLVSENHFDFGETSKCLSDGQRRPRFELSKWCKSPASESSISAPGCRLSGSRTRGPICCPLQEMLKMGIGPLYEENGSPELGLTGHMKKWCLVSSPNRLYIGHVLSFVIPWCGRKVFNARIRWL